jgi:hypothetical protein
MEMRVTRQSMPWTTDYFATGAYMRFSGVTTGDDIVRANAEFHAREYLPGRRFVVADLSGIEGYEVERTDIGRIVDHNVAVAASAMPDLVVAVVAPDLVPFGMARMWEIQTWQTGWRTKIARSRPEAMAWLAEQGIAIDRLGSPDDV